MTILRTNHSLLIPKYTPTTQLRSPVNLPPAVSYNLARTPRAISVSTPENHGLVHSTPPLNIHDDDEDDDDVAAYWDYQFLFISQRSETSEAVSLRVVDGAIPDDFPSGTYYLAGPGMFTDDHGSTVHPLDGHGYLRAFTVDGTVKKDVTFMAKYVKTEAQMEEHDSETDTWRFRYRGPFSVLRGGQKMGNTKVMKNVANTSVLSWGERLLCFWEGGEPYEIESGTLDTVGRFDVMDGGDCTTSLGVGGHVDVNVWDVAAKFLKPILYGVFKMPPKRLLSHYKVDPSRNRLLIMSCNAEDMLLPNSNFTFYEFDSKFKLLQKREFNIPDHLMIHDWAFTDSHYILFGNRIKLDILGSMGAVCGVTPMITALTANPSKSTTPIYLLPRFSDDTPAKNRDWRVAVEAPSQMWLLHVGNAFEDIDHNGNLNIQIHASACAYKWFNFQKLFGYDWQTGKLDPSVMNIENESLPHLVQVSINMDVNGECQKCSVEALNKWSKASDFPVINPRFCGNKNDYIYASSTSGSRHALPSFPFDTVLKLNVSNNSVHTWSATSRRFIGEPIFVPNGDREDDGYLLIVEYAVSIQRCFLLILDAAKIGEADALVARLEVPKHLNFPLGFHGFWAPN